MSEFLTISSEPPDYPGMNFARLRQEGIKHIERLAGQIWTDYNTHDPGITLLEILCYAITDLSYRLSFEMKDLLAYPANTANANQKQFFTAREILTVNPLTINDYRKLIIDIDGVKNAWLEKIDNPLPELYYDSHRHTLTFQPTELAKPIKLNGLYRVLIEKAPRILDEVTLIENVKSRLHQHRNLCEDFAEITVLPKEEITIQASIEIEAGLDANHLMATLYSRLANFISPFLDFFSLEDLLAKGKTPEEIFDGFPLDHGFIDNNQLNQFDRKIELHTSDLIQIILDSPGVKTVRSITLSSNQSSEPQDWVLALNATSTPQLKDISAAIDDITLYKGQIACTLNLNSIQATLQSLSPNNLETPATGQNNDIPIPQGQYRELSDYETIQNEFPQNYGIGDLGLSASASPQRKAQAKQLQAYLTFFDQILANYFAQLDHIKDLFSYHSEDKRTYFSQNIPNLPGRDAILEKDPAEYSRILQELTETPETARERKNRFLDYLIAQYGETFTDYSLLLYDAIVNPNQSPPEKRITDKIAFLQDYPQISGGRGQAFNYTANHSDNVSGIKRRISRLLGIPYSRQPLESSNDTEGFYLIEHILLRPRLSNKGEWISVNHYPDPYSFQISLVFPAWISRFQEENFRQLIYGIMSSEIPAHITPYWHWLEQESMQQFETDYYQWLQQLAEDGDKLQELSHKIIEQLHLGSILSPSSTEIDS